MKQGIEELKRMKGRYAGRDGSKYLNTWIWLIDNAFRVARLSLDREPRCRILDLGAGAGYFLALVRAFGHDGRGIDLGEHPIYTPVNRAFGNEIVWHRVTATSPLPLSQFEAAFDVITAFSVTFDRTKQGADVRAWTSTEWTLFLSRLALSLRPRGLLFLQLNTRNLLGCLGDEYPVFRSQALNEAGFQCVSVGRRRIKLIRSGVSER